MRGRLVELRLTRNRSTILSARNVSEKRTVPVAGSDGAPPMSSDTPGAAHGSTVDDGPHIALRLHRSFVDAPEAVLDAVASYATKRLRKPQRQQALATIRCYFDRFAVHPPHRQPANLDPIGGSFDLREIRDDLERRFFEHSLRVSITWGRSLPRRRDRQRSVVLGSYCEEDRLIRIHRVLDHPQVPLIVLEAVVFHELLHAAMGVPTQRGRRRVHPPEFRRRERDYPHLDSAEAWIEIHLFRLLAGCPRSRRQR